MTFTFTGQQEMGLLSTKAQFDYRYLKWFGEGDTARAVLQPIKQDGYLVTSTHQQQWHELHNTYNNDNNIFCAEP